MRDAISRRWVVVSICAAVVAVISIVLAGNNADVFLYRLLSDGAICVLWLIAAAGWGAGLRKLARGCTEFRLLDVVISIALGLGVISLIVLALGLTGVLNRVSAWSIAVLGLLLFATVLRPRWPSRDWWNQPSPWLWGWAIALPALSVALVGSFAPPGVLWGDEPNGYDVLEYHLQVPREWFEAQRIAPLAHNVYSYLPFNVEMHYLLAMHLRGGPWAGMYLAQLMHLCFIALSVLAIYALVLETIGPPAAVIAALAAATTPWLMLLAPIAYDEGGLLLFAALSIGMVLRARGTRDWVLAGMFAGFACGSKLTAAPMLLIGIPVATLVSRFAKPQAAGLFLLAGLATFAPWMIRNVAWARNPFFPEATEVFGRGKFTETQQQRWQRAHSANPEQKRVGARFAAAGNQIVFDWRFGFVLLPVALLGIAINRTRRAMFLLLLLVICSIVWIGFTHLQSRFFVMAIPICALAIAELVAAKPVLRVGALVVFALCAVAGLIHWHRQYDRLFTLAASVMGAPVLDAVSGAADLDVPAAATLVLAGDAKAFNYSRPMARLRYRTVFDVDEGWLDQSPLRDAVILVDPNELRRFADPRTGYYAIKPPPPEIAARRTPFVLRRE